MKSFQELQLLIVEDGKIKNAKDSSSLEVQQKVAQLNYQAFLSESGPLVRKNLESKRAADDLRKKGLQCEPKEREMFFQAAVKILNGNKHRAKKIRFLEEKYGIKR